MSRWAPGVLLAAALALLASLYLPWQRANCAASTDYFNPSGGQTAGLQNLFAGCPTLDGWSTGVGTGTAVVALFVVVLAGASISRGLYATALGQCALTAGVLGLAVVVQAANVAHDQSRVLKLALHQAYGAYIGIAAVAVLLAGAAASPLRHRVRVRPAPAALVLLAGGLIAALLLLPWQRYAHVKEAGAVYPAGLAAVGLATLVPVAYWRSEIAVLGAAIVLFAGGACSSVVFPATRAYGSWVGLGLAAALGAITLVMGREHLALPRRMQPLLLVAVVCIVSLFLPWQHVCYPGRCLSANAWAFTGSPAIALLVLGVLLTSAAPSGLHSSAELAAGISLFVATLGFSLVDRPELGESFGYGAYVGFVSFAGLVALVLMRSRLATSAPRTIESVPAALLCVAYVVLVLIPAWHVLSPAADDELAFAPFSWLTVAGVLVAVHLFARWVRRVRGIAAHDAFLVVLPLVLLALAALDLIRERGSGMTWGGGGAVALCLGLAALGVAEDRGGLRALPIPEILRVDRIP